MRLWIFIIGVCAMALPTLALEPNDPAQAWLKAPDVDRAIWSARVAATSRSRIERRALLGKIISCLNEATDLGDVKGVSLVDISVVCVAMIDKTAER